MSQQLPSDFRGSGTKPALGDWTHDAIHDGRLIVAQPRRGYRFTVDSLLLAHFAHGYDTSRVLDVGAGCGVISLSLAARNADARIHAIERQPELAACLVRNIRKNGLSSRITALQADVRAEDALPHGTRFAQIVMNPPYYSAASSRQSPHLQRAEARHQLHGDLQALIRASTRHLDSSGSLSLVHPAHRIAAVLDALSSNGFPRLSVTLVHPTRCSEARLLLVNASMAGPDHVRIDPPIVLREAAEQGRDGLPTPQYRRILNPWCAP